MIVGAGRRRLPISRISLILIATSLGCGGGGDSPAAPQGPSQAPFAITHLAPSWGPLSGGTVVTVSGNGFRTGVVVMFGETAATDVRVLGNGMLTAIAPAHPEGDVEVVVTNAAGQKSGLMFSYTDNPNHPCYGCWDYEGIPPP